MINMKKWMLGLAFTLATIFSLPAQAWPEVDHMNMCGSATKVTRAYSGNYRGWAAHDNFVGYKSRAGYYFRTNCPGTKSPVKAAKAKAVKKVAVRKASKKVASTRIAKSSKAKAFKRTVKYDMHADCARVDRMNGYGRPVNAKRRVYNRAVKNIAYRPSPAKRQYNYFKKR